MAGFWLFLLIFAAVCVVALFAWLSFASERAFHRQLYSREPMDDNRFYDSYYAERQIPEDIPRRLKPIYGKYFGIDPMKLRPADRPPEMDDLDTVDLVNAIEREFRVTISDKDAERIDGSFDSIVQYLAEVRVSKR